MAGELFQQYADRFARTGQGATPPVHPVTPVTVDLSELEGMIREYVSLSPDRFHIFIENIRDPKFGLNALGHVANADELIRWVRGNTESAPKLSALVSKVLRSARCRSWLNKLTKDQMSELAKEFGVELYDLRTTPKDMLVTHLMKKVGVRLDELAVEAQKRSGERGFARQDRSRDYSDKKAMMDRLLPEWKRVLSECGGNQPQKFVEAVRIVETPVEWNPTSIGDFDMRMVYLWDGTKLVHVTSFSYDTLPSVAIGSRHGFASRTAMVKPGQRIWDVVYSGQWGGRWARVDVLVAPEQVEQLRGGPLLLEGPRR